MPALPKFLVLLAIFLSANSGDAFMNLSSAAGNLVPVNHLIQFVEPMSKPTNEPTVEPTKQTTSKRGKYSLLKKKDAELPSKITVLITQFTSDTSYAFEAVHGVSHIHVKYIVTSWVTIGYGQDNEIQSMCPDLSLPQPSNWQGPKQRSLIISACVPFASFCSMSSGLAYCWVHSHTRFESVTSTNSAKEALKASAEMQPSADMFQYPGPLAEQPIAAINSSQYNSSADVGLRTARRNSNKIFQLIVRYVFTIRFKQQYQSKMQRD